MGRVISCRSASVVNEMGIVKRCAVKLFARQIMISSKSARSGIIALKSRNRICSMDRGTPGRRSSAGSTSPAATSAKLNRDSHTRSITKTWLSWRRMAPRAARCDAVERLAPSVRRRQQSFVEPKIIPRIEQENLACLGLQHRADDSIEGGHSVEPYHTDFLQGNLGKVAQAAFEHPYDEIRLAERFDQIRRVANVVTSSAQSEPVNFWKRS